MNIVKFKKNRTENHLQKIVLKFKNEILSDLNDSEKLS